MTINKEEKQSLEVLFSSIRQWGFTDEEIQRITDVAFGMKLAKTV